MRPDSFTTLGFVVLIAGFIWFAAGAVLLAEQIDCQDRLECISNTGIVNTAARTANMLLLFTFGIPLLIVGAIFTSVGHMTLDLRKQEAGRDSPIARPVRVCIKCGRQVDYTAGFCPICGNELPK